MPGASWWSARQREDPKTTGPAFERNLAYRYLRGKARAPGQKAGVAVACRETLADSNPTPLLDGVCPRVLIVSRLACKVGLAAVQ